MADFTIKSNDRLPSIQAAFATAGAAVNLASATAVKFIMKSAQGNTVKVNTAAVIVDAATGVVRYDWLSADTATPGSYIAEWEVTWGGGKKQTFPTGTYHTVDVLADLDGA
jgi:hypothetical protein